MSKTWEPIPWPKVDELDRTALREELRQTRIAFNKDIDELIQAEQRIAQLEEALREARATLHEILSGQEDSPLASWDVIGTIDAALSPSEAPEKEGEDG